MTEDIPHLHNKIREDTVADATPITLWATLTALAAALAALTYTIGAYWLTIPVAACGTFAAVRLAWTALTTAGDTR